MFYIYSDSSSGPFDPKMLGVLFKMNPNAKYADHFDNHCYLNFILNHNDTSFVEKQQARKELEIAQKKMDYWKRFPNWTPEESGRLCNEVRKKWGLDPK